MNTPIRLGVIGGGINSAVGRTHHIAATMDRFFEIAAGCYSRDPPTNRLSAHTYGTPRSCASLDELLAPDGSLDAVLVLTPTPDHHSTVKRIQEAGFPVICEKSLACAPHEAVALDGKGFLAVTYNYTGYPMLRELREMIERGELGEITQVIAEMPQEGFALKKGPAPKSWRLHDGKIPTVYLDLGVHLHQIVWFLTRLHPMSTFATEASNGRFAVVDTVMAQVKYEKKMKALFWFGKAALGQRNGLRLRVFGRSGSAEWAQEDPEHLLFCTKSLERAGTVSATDDRRSAPASPGLA
jgi:predicted dehydrogenase